MIYDKDKIKDYQDIDEAYTKIKDMRLGKDDSHFKLEWVRMASSRTPERRFSMDWRITDRQESALQVELTVYKFQTNRSIYTGFSLPIEATRDFVNSLVEQLAELDE